MSKYVIEVILTLREWEVLRALNEVNTLTMSRIVHEKVSDMPTESARTHQILGRLAQYGLVTRQNVDFDGTFGLIHRVLWEVSDEGRRLFFS